MVSRHISLWKEMANMRYRKLGKTGLQVSEIGFGGEWLERHEEAESVELVRYAGEKGINIIDCWMPDPKSRDIIGKGIAGNRENWIIQGHIGSTWQDGQYVRTRDMKYVNSVLPYFSEDYVSKIKQAVPGEALIFGNCVPMPLMVKVDQAKPAPDSSNCHIAEQWYGKNNNDSGNN